MLLTPTRMSIMRGPTIRGVGEGVEKSGPHALPRGPGDVAASEENSPAVPQRSKHRAGLWPMGLYSYVYTQDTRNICPQKT